MRHTAFRCPFAILHCLSPRFCCLGIEGVWKLTGSGAYLDFPHYFDGQLQPVDASKVPAELSRLEFPLDETVLTKEFDGLD